MQHHKYSLSEIDGMIPWEKEVYITMLVEHLKEEEIKYKDMQKGIDRDLSFEKTRKILNEMIKLK